jgi:glucose dehydrogenase
MKIKIDTLPKTLVLFGLIMLIESMLGIFHKGFDIWSIVFVATSLVIYCSGIYLIGTIHKA